MREFCITIQQIKPSSVSTPSQVLAGIITYYLPNSAVLQICRVERSVEFFPKNLKDATRENQASLKGYEVR